MARVQRPWARRIGKYVPGGDSPPKPSKPGRKSEEGEGEPGLTPDAAGDDDTLAEAQEGTQAGKPTDAQPEDQPENASASNSGNPSAENPPDDSPNGESPGAAELPNDLDLSLSIPEEVEQARQDAEEAGRTPWNRNQAPRAFPLEGRYLRGLATRFARMVAKLAEDHADMPDDGDDEWDLNALIRRRFTGRLPAQCRMSREKRKVVIVLDTSPSCEQQARLFGAVAQIAEELGDCEMYDAPNFQLASRWERDHGKRGHWQDLPPDAREWQFRHRVVLAFGDFDGIDHICAASSRRGNRIYWFSCEERPQLMEMQRERFVHDYKGHYFAATHLESLMRAMRRVR